MLPDHAPHEIIFFCKDGHDLLTVTEQTAFLGGQNLYITTKGRTTRYPLDLGGQFFETAEFRDLDGDSKNELLVYHSQGAGYIASVVFRRDEDDSWHVVFQHAARVRVVFHYLTDKNPCLGEVEDIYKHLKFY